MRQVPALEADVVVLGAGPAGVGAAYRSARDGHRVVLLERNDGPGGLAGSFTIAGQRVDHGSHRLHLATHPAILAELRHLLGDDLQLRRRHGRIRLAGRWIAFPLRPGDLVRRLPPGLAARAAFDALTGWARRPAADTFADVLRAGIGPAVCDAFYVPYAQKLWGVPAAALSGEQARRRVAGNSAAKLARRLAGGRGGWFHYPKRGFGQLWERLAEAAAQAGADVRYRTTVTRVQVGAHGARVEVEDGASVTAGQVWSTLPLPLLARIVEPAPPASVVAAAARLEFRAMVLVYLVVGTDRWTPFDAHYLPELSTPVTRLSEPKNYRDGEDPPGQTVLCAEVPCTLGDAVWRASDMQLASLVERTVTDLGLPCVRSREVVVRRLPHAYPIYRAGFERPFMALDEWALAQPRLLSFGRLGLFAHDNSHHALAMAWAAADALSERGFDEHAWSAARQRFRAHVVED